MTASFVLPEAVFASHLAVLGKTGAGKSTTIKDICEHLAPQGARICILDPIKSDYWGLTSSVDGTKPGLPFHILGGPRGHLPLHESSGAAIADLVATGALPLSILDMKKFGPGGLSRFFIDFAPALLDRMRGVVYLIIDEAHLFAPKERSGLGDENLGIHYAKLLATAGRSEGIRLILATQRTQALHNAMLGSCETVVAHRLTAPADQKPVLDWLKANVAKDIATEIAGELSSLPTGTGWVCSGEAKFFERVEFPRITTFDNSATPTGSLAEINVRTAAVDVEKLRAIIGDAAAEAEANDPKLLKAEIARLKAQAGKTPLVSRNPAELSAAREQGYAEGLEAGERIGRKNAIQLLGKSINSLIDTAAAAAEIGTARAASSEPAKIITPSGPPLGAPPRPLKPSASAAPQTKGAMGLVVAAAQVHPVRLTWGQVATLAGRKPSGGHFNSSKKTAVDSGWLTEASGLVSVTADGLAAAGVTPADGDPADIFAAALPQPAAKMFAALRERPGMTITGLSTVLQMQPRGGHWNNGIATLRRNGLIREEAGAIHLIDLRGS